MIAVDWWAIAFIIVGVVGAMNLSKIAMNRRGSYKDIVDNYKKIQKSRDEYIDELEDTVQHYKNKASNMERGPKLEGDLNDIGAFLPDLVSQFEPYAPKWLKPFLKNTETQKMIIDYAQKNPQIIAKFLKKKGEKEVGKEKTEGISV